MALTPMSAGKIHQSRSLIDKALQPEDSKYCRLSIQLSLDGFSFCILDQQREKYLALASWDFQNVSNNLALSLLLKDFLPTIQWLEQDFRETAIIIETPQCTLVPNPLFKQEHAEQYLRFNHYVDHDHQVRHDYLPLLDAENIWAVHGNILQLLKDHIPAAHIHHHSSSLIEALMLQNKNRGNEESVFVNVRKSRFDVVVLKGNNLLLYNAFNYRTKEDFAYFLVYVLEFLELNPEKVEVTLLGEIVKDSALYGITYKYVRNIRFGKRNSDYGFSYVFDEIPEHFYFNLIHLQQCGL